jgi:hypothetical protein
MYYINYWYLTVGYYSYIHQKVIILCFLKYATLIGGWVGWTKRLAIKEELVI